jgi:hypothetical protein
MGITGRPISSIGENFHRLHLISFGLARVCARAKALALRANASVAPTRGPCVAQWISSCSAKARRKPYRCRTRNLAGAVF